MNQEHRNRLDHLSNLHTEKNAKYGSSFDKGLEKYGLDSWRIRDDDKSSRFDQLIKEALKQDAEGRWYLDDVTEGSDESIHDTLLDRANYLIMLDMWLDSLPRVTGFNDGDITYVDNLALYPPLHEPTTKKTGSKSRYPALDEIFEEYSSEIEKEIERLVLYGEEGRCTCVGRTPDVRIPFLDIIKSTDGMLMKRARSHDRFRNTDRHLK